MEYDTTLEPRHLGTLAFERTDEANALLGTPVPIDMTWLAETPDAPVPAGPVHYFEHCSPICHDERDPCLGTHDSAQVTCDDCREILTAAGRRERQTREEL